MPRPHPAAYKKFKIFSRFFVFGRPVWCAWQVTYRCNFKCTFCDYWKCRVKPSDELGLKEIEAGCRNLSRITSMMISIGGGEPFIRPDLPQIIKIMARYHMPLITTNGWHVTREVARNVFRAGLWGASISIDYANEEKHDRARGIEGAHKRALKALEHLSEERCGKLQRINLMTVLMKDNIEEIEPLIRLAARYGAYFMVQPYCNMKGGGQDFVPDIEVGDYLLKLRKKYDNFISNPYFLERFDLAFDGGVPNCKAGKAFFNIDNYGRVSKCVEDIENPIGNIVTDDPMRIIRRLNDSWQKNNCSGCWYNCRGEIESLFNPRGFLNAMPVVLSTWSRTSR